MPHPHRIKTFTGSRVGRRIVFALVISAVAVAVIVVAGSSASAPKPNRPQVQESALHRAPRISRAAAAALKPDHYHVLLLARRRTAGGITLPSSGTAAERIAYIQSLFGLNLADAAEVTGPSGQQLFLVPGSSGHCVIENTPAMYEGATCGATVGASGFVGWEDRSSSGDEIVGFVPNDNTTVTLTFSSGQTEAVNVYNNAVFASTTAAENVVSLTDTGLEGSTEVTPLS